ncbi:putative P-loop containing nucleoside triphosphate hydrolase [Dioscorea sansibarensis]
MGGGSQTSFNDDISPSSPSSSDGAGGASSGARYHRAYLDLLQAYETTADRAPSLARFKDALRRFKPGDWIEFVGGTALADYVVPETTTLLLVGPRASGKTSLVNRISRAFEDDDFLPDRAQVSYNPDVSQGTFFAQEYMIPRNSKSFCIYDTRSLSMVPCENFKLLERWMKLGVSHGEMVIRDSDDAITRKRMKDMAQRFRVCQRRTVNFVIFVVNATSVLKSMDENDREYLNLLIETFNYPFLSLRDSKPVVVVTHGDGLSLSNRARVCAYLGEVLCIPPTKQIFDIPDTDDSVSELAIMDMLRYSLEHADRNLPSKFKPFDLLEGQKMLSWTVNRSQTMLDILGCICITVLLFHFLSIQANGR